MAGSLFFPPRHREFNANGAVSPGARLYFYVSGTTTPATVYQNSALSLAHTNPVLADAGGLLPAIWLDPAVTYKAVLKTALDATVWEVDPYPGSPVESVGLGRALYPQTTAESGAGVTPVNYLYPPYDLRRYGAVLNGSTDDGAAVRNWTLAAAQAGAVATYGGGEATALCSAFTPINTALTVRIHAPNLTIRGPVAATVFASVGGNLYCTGVTFDRWLSVFARGSSDSGSTTRFVVTGCTFQNCTGIPISMLRPISHYWIERNVFDTCSGGYAILIGTNTYADQDTWTKGIVAKNIFKSLTASGSASCAAALIYGREVSITDNIIDGVQGASGEGWGIYTKTRYAVITGNLIRNVSSTSHPDVVGINIKGTIRSVTSSPQGFSVVCANNQIFNVGVSGTSGIGIRAQTDDVTVANNIVEDAGIHGINFDENAGSNNIQVDNNKIRFSVATGRTGVYTATGGGKHRVTNNVITGAATGVRVAGSGGAAGSDYEYAGNQIGASTAAFDINTPTALDRVRIYQNVLTTAATFGLVNSAGAGAITRLEVMDNDFSRATTLISGVMPAGSRIRQSRRLQTTDATVTPGVAFDLADDSAWSVDARIVGKKADGTDRALYHKKALVYRDGGAATVQGSVASVVSDIESDATWGATTLDVNTNAVRAVVAGKAATTIDWHVELDAVGV